MLNALQFTDHRRSLAVPLLFAALEPELQSRLLEGGILRHYSDGQFIQYHGTEADGFWLIEAGSVRVGQHIPNGEFRTIALLGPGDSYGELAVFTGRPRVVDALSRGQSSVRFIAGGTFLAELDAFPQSSKLVMRSFALLLQDSVDRLVQTRRGNYPAQLAGILINLADTQGKVAVTQQELADILGVTRVTANAALSTLAKAKVIERGYGVITIKDAQGLRRFSQSL